MLLVDLINNWPKEFEIHLILLQNRIDLEHLIDLEKIGKTFIIPESLSSVRQIFLIRSYFKRNKIKFCLAHLEKPNKFCLLASVFSSTNIVPVVHNINIYHPSSSLNFAVSRLIYYLLAKKVVAISSAVKAYCCESLRIKRENLIQIDNGIDFTRISKYGRNFSFDGEIRFAVLGRLEPAKGFDILINALGNTHIRNLNWKLRIIGDGSQMQNLKAISEKLKIIEKITFLGAQKCPFHHLADVHFLVMPSRKVGLPISLLESLSFGIPVISSNVGVLPKIVRSEFNGFVFSAEDIDMLVDKILCCFNIMKDQQQYRKMVANAQISVEDYSINNCLSKYLQLIEIFEK